MAGPTPIALGQFQFQALGFHLTDLTRDLQTPWAEIDVAMRFDALHWTGPKSDSVTIKGVLFPEEFGGLNSLHGIAASARAGKPLTLATGAGDIGGKFVVIGISEDWTVIDGRGRPRRDAYQIQLRKLQNSSAGGLGGALSLFGGVGGIASSLGGVSGALSGLSGLTGAVGALGGLGSLGSIGGLVSGAAGALGAVSGLSAIATQAAGTLSTALNQVSGLTTLASVARGVSPADIVKLGGQLGVSSFATVRNALR